jgi:hypothetical protein
LSKVVKLESKSPAPTGRSRLQKVPSKAPEPSRLTPELKGFIDRVVVPIMVKSYIEKLQSERVLAESSKNTRTCQPMTDTLHVEAAQ